MSTITPVPNVPPVRTYATDLTAQRAARDMVPKTPKIVAPLPVPKNPTVPAVKKSVAVRVIPKVATLVPVPPVPLTATEKKSAVIPPFHTFQKPTGTNTTLATIDTSELTTKQALVKPSVLAVPTKEILSVNRNTKPEDDATIITDTKHSRFSITKEIIQALTKRFKTYQKNAAASKKPKYTLPETERRKGVIQKAAVRTGRTSTADHAAVLDRIKNTNRPLPETTYSTLPAQTNPAEPSLTETKKPTFISPAITTVSLPPIQNPIASATWSTDTSNQAQNDVLAAMLLTPSVAPIPEQPTPIPVLNEIITVPAKITAEELPSPLVTMDTPSQVIRPRIVPIVPTVHPVLPQREVIIPIVPTLPIEDTAPLVIPDIGNTTPTVTIPRDNSEKPVTPTPQPIARPRIVPILPNQEKPQRSAETVLVDAFIETEEASLPKPVANWALPKTETSRTKLHRLLSPADAEESVLHRLLRSTNQVAIIGVSVVFIGMIMVFGMRTLYTKVATTLTASQGTPTENQTAFTDSVLHNAVITTLDKQSIITTITEKSTGTDSLVEVRLTDPETKEYIKAAAFLDLFNATVGTDFKATLSNISVGGYRGEPWILLTTTDSETARGGVLQWEKTLGNDLSPWFGAALKQNLGSKGSMFTDNIISTHDVRVLSDNQKTEWITYGFIQPNQLLITTNTTAFLNLAEKRQK